MQRTTPRKNYRWIVVAIFFAFMLLHQTDKLLIGPLNSDIMETFGIDEAAMGFVGTGALLVGAIFYPLWGYLYDRFARAKLIALASLIWGSTTWLGAIAPTYPAFLAARASTGIDDSSYPGIFSLVADYFGPGLRGKIYGILQLAQPMGYMLGLVLALFIAASLGWRNVFFITGGVGVVLAVVIFLFVREMPRGKAEPELAELAEIAIYRFDRKAALQLFSRRSILFLFAQGFFGVFPWTVISFWFFRYLEVERGYGSNEIFLTMGIAVLVLSAGYFVGGALGDWLFKRTPRGRLIICTIGVFSGAVLLLLTVSIPTDAVPSAGLTLARSDAGEIVLSPQAERPAANAGIQEGDVLLAVYGVPVPADLPVSAVQALLTGEVDAALALTVRRASGIEEVVNVPLALVGSFSPLFLVMLCATALFIPFAGPNVISTVYDITVPEVRSTALAIQYFIENFGAAFAPGIAGLIAVQTSLSTAIVLICFSTWMIGGAFLIGAAIRVPKDIHDLRDAMQARARESQELIAAHAANGE